jgi:hypothetical protein
MGFCVLYAGMFRRVFIRMKDIFWNRKERCISLETKTCMLLFLLFLSRFLTGKKIECRTRADTVPGRSNAVMAPRPIAVAAPAAENGTEYMSFYPSQLKQPQQLQIQHTQQSQSQSQSQSRVPQSQQVQQIQPQLNQQNQTLKQQNMAGYERFGGLQRGGMQTQGGRDSVSVAADATRNGRVSAEKDVRGKGKESVEKNDDKDGGEGGGKGEEVLDEKKLDEVEKEKGESAKESSTSLVVKRRRGRPSKLGQIIRSGSRGRPSQLSQIIRSGSRRKIVRSNSRINVGQNNKDGSEIESESDEDEDDKDDDYTDMKQGKKRDSQVIMISSENEGTLCLLFESHFLHSLLIVDQAPKRHCVTRNISSSSSSSSSSGTGAANGAPAGSGMEGSAERENKADGEGEGEGEGEGDDACAESHG